MAQIGEAQHPAAASHRYGGEYMAPFSDFDAALPYVAEMPKTLAELLKSQVSWRSVSTRRAATGLREGRSRWAGRSRRRRSCGDLFSWVVW